MKALLILCFNALVWAKEAEQAIQQSQFLQNPQAVSLAADKAIQDLNHEFATFQEQETNNAELSVNSFQGAHPVKTDPGVQLRGAPHAPTPQVGKAQSALPAASTAHVSAAIRAPSDASQMQQQLQEPLNTSPIQQQQAPPQALPQNQLLVKVQQTEQHSAIQKPRQRQQPPPQQMVSVSVQTAEGAQFSSATDMAMEHLAAEFVQFQQAVANRSAQLRLVVGQEERSNAAIEVQNVQIQNAITQLNMSNQVLRQEVKGTADKNRHLRADLENFGKKLKEAQAAASAAIEGSDSNDQAAIMAAEGQSEPTNFASKSSLVYTAKTSPGVLIAPAIPQSEEFTPVPVAQTNQQPVFTQVTTPTAPQLQQPMQLPQPVAAQQMMQLQPAPPQQQQDEQLMQLVNTEQPQQLVNTEQPQQVMPVENVMTESVQMDQMGPQPQPTMESMQEQDQEDQGADQGDDEVDDGQPDDEAGAASFLTVSIKRHRGRPRGAPQQTSTLGEDTLSFLTKSSTDFAMQEEKTVQNMETSFWNTVHSLRKHHSDSVAVQKKLNATYSSEFALHSRLTTTKAKLESTRNHLQKRVQMLKGALRSLGQGNNEEAAAALNHLPNAAAAL